MVADIQLLYRWHVKPYKILCFLPEYIFFAVHRLADDAVFSMVMLNQV